MCVVWGGKWWGSTSKNGMNSSVNPIYPCLVCARARARQYCSGRSFREAVIYFSGQPCDEKETTGHCALTSLIRVCVSGMWCDEAVRIVRNEMENTLKALKPILHFWFSSSLSPSNTEQCRSCDVLYSVHRCLQRCVRMVCLSILDVLKVRRLMDHEWCEFSEMYELA